MFKNILCILCLLLIISPVHGIAKSLGEMTIDEKAIAFSNASSKKEKAQIVQSLSTALIDGKYTEVDLLAKKLSAEDSKTLEEIAITLMLGGKIE